MRESQERERVAVPRGAVISFWMPTEAERVELGIEVRVAVVPVAVVTVGGRVRGVSAGDRVELTTA